MNTIPAEVARKIGYYVYLLIDPRTGKPFYVGKGKGSRALTHLEPDGSSSKDDLVADLLKAGLAPGIDILAHGLPDEETAYRVEAAVIDALGLERLTNEVRGWRSIEQGRMPLRQLVAYYAAAPVTINHPSLLIRINQRYSHGMPEAALYDATRGIWRLSAAHAKDASCAMAVFEGVVREVYEIEAWHPAGQTSSRPAFERPRPLRGDGARGRSTGVVRASRQELARRARRRLAPVASPAREAPLTETLSMGSGRRRW